jgi:hypothetical protein
MALKVPRFAWDDNVREITMIQHIDESCGVAIFYGAGMCDWILDDFSKTLMPCVSEASRQGWTIRDSSDGS